MGGDVVGTYERLGDPTTLQGQVALLEAICDTIDQASAALADGKDDQFHQLIDRRRDLLGLTQSVSSSGWCHDTSGRLTVLINRVKEQEQQLIEQVESVLSGFRERLVTQRGKRLNAGKYRANASMPREPLSASSPIDNPSGVRTGAPPNKGEKP